MSHYLNTKRALWCNFFYVLYQFLVRFYGSVCTKCVSYEPKSQTANTFGVFLKMVCVVKSKGRKLCTVS